MKKKKVFLDVECYRNYFLICFKSNVKAMYFELYEGSERLNKKLIKKIMETYTTIGFNSKRYDLPMISLAIGGEKDITPKQLRAYSDHLIIGQDPMLNNFSIDSPYLPPLNWDHIDIINPSPAVRTGLKMYGARMHTKCLQELPYDPLKFLTKEEYLVVREYCFNDIDITMELYNQIENRIILRENMSKEWDYDLRSKSDAQIAEKVLKKMLGVGFWKWPNKLDIYTYKYIPPCFIKFKIDSCNDFLEKAKTTKFNCNSEGKVIKNDIFKHVVDIKGIQFIVGIGGLHSKQKHIAIIPADDEILLDVDVNSYYPSIILNNKYYPKKLGEGFLKIYKFFYDERLNAKKNNDKIKSDSYKIILNGSFGKFGSPYSCLYSPDLMIHTTLTGQLSLLMLIESIMINGFEVVSANTDGITIKGKKDRVKELRIILKEWETTTGFTLEETHYKALYHESVNSYIAITTDGKVKCKGSYGEDTLTKNPIAPVCSEAVVAYLTKGIKIEDYILQNKGNIRKFLIVRKVTSGAEYKGKFIGKLIRWYYGLNDDIIISQKKGDKVALSDGAVPLMKIPDSLILDIDLNKYITKAYKMLKNLGVKENVCN